MTTLTTTTESSQTLCAACTCLVGGYATCLSHPDVSVQCLLMCLLWVRNNACLSSLWTDGMYTCCQNQRGRGALRSACCEHNTLNYLLCERARENRPGNTNLHARAHALTCKFAAATRFLVHSSFSPPPSATTKTSSSVDLDGLI